MDKIYRYITIFALLLGSVLGTVSCKDDDLLVDVPEVDGPAFGDDVYCLNFVATLDNMGSRSVYDSSKEPEEITKWENYIDLERFRVLFFDEDDKFIFESKNRWVKQVDADDHFSSWYISVPLGAFGNDSYGAGQEYDWDAIHTFLTTHRFKVALLVNRPAKLLYPGFIDSELELTEGVFDNDGPYWGPGDVGEKSLFDLHHYQYDVIYTDKGEHRIKTNSCYYDFVMGEIDTDRPTMGSAINWVSFDNGDTDKDQMYNTSNYMRNIKMPSAEHPIPMYGIQQFDPIPDKMWRKGTPFDISNEPAEAFPDIAVELGKYDYRSIALLRCCVRLDLKIPKSVKNGAKPTYVTLWYSNIYSRTEPMDTWTPTDQIWNQNGMAHSDGNCEMSRLISFGPVVTNKDPGNGGTKDKYQERIKWFYGAWLDRDWKFKRVDGKTMIPEKNGIEYPRIFNACIQRNKVIQLKNGDMTNYFDDKGSYWHYVVYTGERSPNDVNSLPDMPKNPYIVTFVISWDDTKFYCIPLLNYEKNTDTSVAGVFGPTSDGKWKDGSTPSAYNTYINTTLPASTGNNIPYPLLRNHIYKFTLSGKARSTDDELDNIRISSEVLATPDINFSEKVKVAPIKANLNNESVNKTTTSSARLRK